MTVLDRWLLRCREASSTGEGLEDLRRDQRQVRAGVKAAVRAACRGNGAGDPLRCLERAAVVLGKRTAWEKDVAWTGGYRVALRWLREEIEADEARTRRALLLLTDDFCEFCVIGSTWHYHAPDCPIGQALGHLSAADSDRIEQEREAALREIPKPRPRKGGES